jgi:hypothetical protein
MSIYCKISAMIRIVVIVFILGVAAGAFVTARAGGVSAPEVAPSSFEMVLGSQGACCGVPLDHLPACPAGPVKCLIGHGCQSTSSMEHVARLVRWGSSSVNLRRLAAAMS